MLFTMQLGWEDSSLENGEDKRWCNAGWNTPTLGADKATSLTMLGDEGGVVPAGTEAPLGRGLDGTWQVAAYWDVPHRAGEGCLAERA